MKTNTRPFSPSLKLGKNFKRIISSVINKDKRGNIKRIFLDAEQSFLNRTYYKPERTKNDE
jgi:hypothetical protein